MIDYMEVMALLDDQDPRLNPIPMDCSTPPTFIWGKRKYLVDSLLRVIHRDDNKLRRKAQTTLKALMDWRKENLV
jgi:hypothetical protein